MVDVRATLLKLPISLNSEIIITSAEREVKDSRRSVLRNVSKLQFFDKIGQAKSVGFRLYSAI